MGTTAAERFHALDAIAVRAQAVRDPEALFPAVGAALSALGLVCHIDEWDATSGDVIIRYVSLSPAVRHAAEALLGRQIEGTRLPAARVPSLTSALTGRHTVYLSAPEDDVTAAVPWLSRAAVRSLMRLLQFERAIVAPLVAGEVVLGVLVVIGRELGEADVPFMASLGTHVGEALAAARLLETARRREAAALALGELSARVAAGAAPHELPALAVQTLRQPLGAAAAILWLLEETSAPGGGREPALRLAAQEGLRAPVLRRVETIPLTSERLAARVAREGRTMALCLEETEQELPDTRANLADAGFGLAIAAPLCAAGRVLGVLSLTFRDARPAPADERAFVEAVAAQVAAALENARLLAESRAQSARAALLADLATMLARIHDPGVLLTTLAQRTADALHGCAAIYLAREDGDDLAVATVHHPDAATLALIKRGLAETPPRAGVGVLGQAYAEKRALLVRFDDPTVSEAQRVYAERVGATSTMAVPLLAHGRVPGVLAVSSLGDERPFGPDDLALATAIGSVAAQALDNARSYAAAEEGRRRLAATFESMVDAIFLYDRDGRVIDLNEAAIRLLGLPARPDAPHPIAAYLGRFVELRHPDGRLIDADSLPSLRAVRGETVVDFEETVHVLATGEERRVILNAAPIRDDEGGILGAVLVAHDVTELRAAERAKDEFLGAAGHELKTPLTPLKGFAQIVETMLKRADAGAPLDHARLRRYVHLMAERIDHLIELVDGMLDFSRLQTGRFALAPVPTDVAALAAAVLARHRDQVEALDGDTARHTFVLDAPEPVVAHCDPQRLDQVLTNLVANALKYSPRGGCVLVRVARDGDRALLSVEDEGIGIPAGEVETLFQPFARGSNAPAMQYPGVGLGLYICREIVERHGGSISARPRDPTGAQPGTIISVSLPQ